MSKQPAVASYLSKMAQFDYTRYMRQYRRQNVDKSERDNEVVKGYHKTEAGRAALKAANCNTSAKNRGAIGRLSKDDILSLWSKGLSCKKCGSVEGVEIDHVKPIFLGGQNCYENLQLLCKPCHAKKTRMEKMIKTQPQNVPESFWAEINAAAESKPANQATLF